MRTLDEVIRALEICWEQGTCSKECPYMMAKPSCGLRRELDALHYLKEYKRVQKKIEKIAIGNIEDVLDKIDNPPLTWDELRQMEGKPVWVEYIKGGKRVDAEWIVIKKVKSTCIENTSGRFQADSLEWTWQAYRKERS